MTGRWAAPSKLARGSTPLLASGDLISKPRGMRWRTYDRHMHRVKQAEATVTAHTRKLLQSLNSHLER